MTTAEKLKVIRSQIVVILLSEIKTKHTLADKEFKILYNIEQQLNHLNSNIKNKFIDG